MNRISRIKKSARLSVSLDEQAYTVLCQIARQDDVSVAWLVRRAVNELIGHRAPANDKNPPAARRAGKARRA